MTVTECRSAEIVYVVEIDFKPSQHCMAGTLYSHFENMSAPLHGSGFPGTNKGGVGYGTGIWLVCRHASNQDKDAV